MAGAGAKLFTAFSKLTAAQVNTFLMDQTIMRFATTAARDAAFNGAGEPTLAEGMTCYLDDTNVLQTYTGSAWVEIASTDSKAPRGIMAVATTTSNVVSAQSSEVTLASVSFTAVANRNYRIQFFCGLVNNINNVIQNTYLRLDSTSGTILNQTETYIVGSQGVPNNVLYVGTLTAGTRSIFARALQTSTNASSTYYGSATRPMVLIVEDIGAV